MVEKTERAVRNGQWRDTYDKKYVYVNNIDTNIFLIVCVIKAAISNLVISKLVRTTVRSKPKDWKDK
jgi:hypothetical protein